MFLLYKFLIMGIFFSVDTFALEVMEAKVQGNFSFESKYLNIAGSKIHYVDFGQGTPIVFIHGNPTSSYIWRNILPKVAKTHRVIALDLIGMGKSDKPKIEYSFFDQSKYFTLFMRKLNLKKIILVMHGWGGALGIDYAVRHPDKISGLILMEALIFPISTRDEHFKMQKIFFDLRDPMKGHKLVIQENYMIEKFLPQMTGRVLSDTEWYNYRMPFLSEASRYPIWSMLRDLPIDGSPSSIYSKLQNNYNILRKSSWPVLLITATPGAVINSVLANRLEKEIRNLKIKNIGYGFHYIQESQPTNIADSILAWSINIQK